ncbi:MAG TPA: glucosamine-6-phosphate deaminase [Ignavibacteriaceae bacterium]|nr:glucosamine-6-phosphate deaminase [Ignavibacteriaceae bacterium]
MISKVEQYYLELSQKELIYKPTEKIPVIQVANFPELGKMTALRFIEWVQKNPNGVISLPTGKTPEHFIKWVAYLLKNWNKADVVDILKKVDIDSSNKPDIANLRFVQIDEFYPIDSHQHNSFYYYIQKYYFSNWGLDIKKALLMNINEIPTANNLSFTEIFPDENIDLSLRTRWASTTLERYQKQTIELVDQFSTDYEKKIRDMGGIGFFLGGIGPDGHIGFNVKGSDHYSTTRLIQTNYETQAAAATDLGGIEVAKKRLVITIGLDTITYNPDATAIIIAAGEAKGNIVRDSIQTAISNQYPATVLQRLPNARFYLTDGAAFRLVERRYHDVLEEKEISDVSVERAAVNLCLDRNKALLDLSVEDYNSNKLTKLILERTKKSPQQIGSKIHQSIIERFNRGMAPVSNQVILHTGPHHDDITLGYLPYISHLVRDASNTHYFVTMTSGFTAVTNSYMVGLLEDLKYFLGQPDFISRTTTNYFDPEFQEGKDRDVHLYLDGLAAHSKTIRKEAVSRRLLRNMMKLYKEERVDELINYFKTQYPGKKDIPEVQKLKGMMREWEEELVWAFFGINTRFVSHMRLGFYQGDIFTENPEMDRDVIPIFNLLKKIKPTVVSVALDPEGSGPDTHYKVLQATAEALKLYEKETGINNIKVWGYRNVWYRFHPAEANIFIPVSLNSMAIMESTFLNSYESQRAASFPSWEYDGPFSRLAQRIQVEQYQTIRLCLGKDYFLKHPYPRVQAAYGMVYLNELSQEEFYAHSSELRKLTENY